MGGNKKAKEIDSERELLAVDVAEHEVERQKNRRDITAASKSIIR